MHKKHQNFAPPLRKSHLHHDSTIVLLGKKENILAFAAQYKLKAKDHLELFASAFNPIHAGFSEVIITPGAKLVGTDMHTLHMRRNYGLQVLSLYRNNRYYSGSAMSNLQIQAGDTLAILGSWKDLWRFDQDNELAMVTTDYPREKTQQQKRPLAIFISLITLLLLIFSVVPVALALMIGALGMVLSKIIDMDEAYRAISWKTVFLLGAFVPFGQAMQSSGTANYIAQNLIHSFGHVSNTLLLLGLSIMAMLFSLLMSNVGATVVLAPIAIQMALMQHASPQIFAVITALATSNSFLLPTHQVNALLSGPGGYRVTDFIKIGGIVSIIYLVALIGLGPLYLR